MPSLSTLPEYVAPGREAKLTFALTESGTNFVRVWVTNAPPKSGLRAELDGSTQVLPKPAPVPVPTQPPRGRRRGAPVKAPAPKAEKSQELPRARFQIYQGDGQNVPKAFDVGGKYTFVAQEYISGASAYGGSYDGAPDAAPSETPVGTETTLTLYVGERMTSTISAGEDSVKLVLWNWNATIRETTAEVHGEVSPALQKESPTPRETAAIESTAVRSALAALVGVSVTTATGTPSTIFGNAAGGFVKEWNDHMAQASVHQTNDSDNDLPIGLSSAASAKTLKDAVNAVLPYIRQHYTNDAVNGATVSGRDSGNYHNVSTKVNDNVNLPLVTSAGSNADAYWALADLWRSYEAHRVSTAVHDAADNTNALTALPVLLQVALQIFTVWAAVSPTVPDTMTSGAVTLISTAGFGLEPL